MALTMRALGFPNAFALTGGFDAWSSAGGQLEPLARSDPATNTAHHQPM